MLWVKLKAWSIRRQSDQCRWRWKNYSLLRFIQVHFTNFWIVDCAFQFEFTVLSNSNRREVLRMNCHPERLHTLLGEYPVDYSLRGFFGVALVLVSFVDREGDSYRTRVVGWAADTDLAENFPCFFIEKQPAPPTGLIGLIYHTLNHRRKEIVHHGRNLKRAREPESEF